MRKADAAVWTFENVRRIAPAFQGLPTAAVYPMHKHCKLAQTRFRFIWSSEVLNIPRYEGEDYTCHGALGERNGWTNKAAKDMVMRISFRAVRSLDRKASTVTSGPHHIGADNANSLSTEHIPTAADRAILQGYEEEDLPRFLASTSETSARKMVADVIPPPFANKMAHAVYPHLRSKLSAHKLKAQLKVREKADLTYRQAQKAVEQVSAGVFTISAFVDACYLQEEAVSRVVVLIKGKHTTPTNEPAGNR